MLLLVHKRTSSLEVKFCQANLIAVKNGKEIVKMAVKQRPVSVTPVMKKCSA
jgi:hypothetical protein